MRLMQSPNAWFNPAPCLTRSLARPWVWEEAARAELHCVFTVLRRLS